jgi:hypothetical protein
MENLWCAMLMMLECLSSHQNDPQTDKERQIHSRKLNEFIIHKGNKVTLEAEPNERKNGVCPLFFL